MQGRVPATRHCQAIRLDHFLAARGRAHGDRAQAQTPLGAHHLRPGIDRPVTALGRIVAHIDQGGDLHARRRQIAGGAMGIVIVAKDRDLLPRRHAPAVKVGTHRARRHHAGPVIHRKGDLTLVGAGCKDRPLGHDAPETFARQFGGRGRVMQSDPFQRPVGATVVGPGHRGAPHQPHIGHRTQLSQHIRHPQRAGLACNILDLGVQSAAKEAVFFGQNHLCPGPTGDQCCHQPGRPRPDHQKIAMRPGLFIVILIVPARQGAQTRRPADGRLIDLFPKAARPHEGLVIKSRTQKRCCQIVDFHHVKGQRRPAVLAARLQPLIDFLHRGAHIGDLARALPDRDQRRRLFGTRRHHPARPVIFERTAKEPHAARQQCRGQRVALKPAIVPPVKAKTKGPPPVNDPLARNPHDFAPSPFLRGFFCVEILPPEAFFASAPATRRAARISWVTVLRVSSIQAEQPIS